MEMERILGWLEGFDMGSASLEVIGCCLNLENYDQCDKSFYLQNSHFGVLFRAVEWIRGVNYGPGYVFGRKHPDVVE